MNDTVTATVTVLVCESTDMSSPLSAVPPTTTVPVMDGIILVHTDDHTISYDGRRYSEEELRSLSRCLARLTADVEAGTLKPHLANWGDWLLEVNDAGEIFIGGLLTNMDKLNRYTAGCAEALAILDGESSDQEADALTRVS